MIFDDLFIVNSSFLITHNLSNYIIYQIDYFYKYFLGIMVYFFNFFLNQEKSRYYAIFYFLNFVIRLFIILNQ